MFNNQGEWVWVTLCKIQVLVTLDVPAPPRCSEIRIRKSAGEMAAPTQVGRGSG
jgi:hypothetical protein